VRVAAELVAELSKLNPTSAAPLVAAMQPKVTPFPQPSNECGLALLSRRRWAKCAPSPNARLRLMRAKRRRVRAIFILLGLWMS
jgi:hypothetical protein